MGAVNLPQGLDMVLRDLQRRIDHVRDRGGQPWISVPGMHTFRDSTGSDATDTYGTLPVSACSGGVAWEGIIAEVTHPVLEYKAVLGRVPGSVGAPTYELYVGGDLVDTVATTIVDQVTYLRGPFGLGDKIGDTNVSVQLTVSATGPGTDRVAASMIGCWLRQT